MSKETVELTIRIPKRLMDVLEQEDYFGWSKEDFFVVAVQRGIGCEMSAMDFDDMKKLETKYGFDPGEIQFNKKNELIYP